MTEEAAKYEEVLPTPTAYARMLCHIIRDGQKPSDKTWAIEQVCLAFRAIARRNPEKWGEEPNKDEPSR